MDTLKLTAIQRWELQMQNNYGPQPTSSCLRAKVQNALVAWGLSEFVDGKRRCGITKVGRAELEK